MLKNKQRFFTVGATVAAVAAAGYVMQRDRGAPVPVGTAAMGPVSAATAAPAEPAQSAAVPAPTPAPDAARVVDEITEITEAAEIVDKADAADPVAETGETLIAALETAEAPAVLGDAALTDAALPTPPADALMPAPLPQPGAGLQDRMAVTEPASGTAPIGAQPERNQFGLTCGPVLSASVKAAGMVSLTLTAPCRGDQRITVQHGALAFSDRLDALGTYTVEVPAMAEAAAFTARFDDGETVATEIAVPIAGEIERAALMYRGDTGLQIHALEFGADYGEDGHVWAGAPRDAASALTSGGGFVTVLGDAGIEAADLAQVYTYPGNATGQYGVVRLSVEAEVTAANCGTEVAGQIIEPALTGAGNSVALTVSVPDCSAVGEFLVLKNLLRDLKIASN